jgi:hypothetical protein
VTLASKDELATRLKATIDYVRDCDRRVSQGEIMDLQGLDDTVVEICDSIAELEEEEGQSLEPQMATLIKGLEQLAETMKEQEEKMGEA